MQVSFPGHNRTDTPRPYSKATERFEGNNSLATLLVHHKGPTVTPEYPPKETILPIRSTTSNYMVASPASTVSFQSSTNTITALQQELSSPASATLAPRPGGQNGDHLKGVLPVLPLMKSERSTKTNSRKANTTGGNRLNKFVRRLHDMLQAENNSGVVEWRRGLLVLYSTDTFAKKLLPKYFATKNFKTFRRQLNYYGFVHVRSFNTTGASPTALWVNRSLANEGSDDISAVLKLKRVEPCEAAKTVEGRRQRKELAKYTVEKDLGVNAKTLQLEQIRSMTLRGQDTFLDEHKMTIHHADSFIPQEVHVVFDPIKSMNGDQHLDQSKDRESETAANVLLMLSRS